MGPRGPACPMRKGHPFERIDAKRGRRAGIAACRMRTSWLFAFLPNLTLLVLAILAWQPASTVWLPRIDPAHGGAYAGANYDCTHGRRNDRIRRAILSSLASLKREASVFVFAATAIPLGIAMGWWRLVYNQVNPIMEICARFRRWHGSPQYSLV